MQLERIREHDGAGTDSPRWRAWRRRSILAAWAILAIGVLASASAGLWLRASLQTESQRSFEQTASDVNATLGTMLRRDADFVTTLRAVLSMEPNMGASRFERWFAGLHGDQRQLGGLGTSVIEHVPEASLAAFLSRRNSDPAFRAFVGGHVAGLRAPGGPSCLLAAGVSTDGQLEPQVAQSLQSDWCQPSSPIGISQAVPLRTQADTGELLVLPVTTRSTETTMFFQCAFYRRGMPLHTLAQRHAALAGWVSSSFDIPAVIRAATRDHPGLGVALYHANPGQPAELVDRIGVVTRPNGFHHRADFRIEGTWAVVISQAAVAGSGLSPGLQGLLVALGGASLSFLLFALILVLARSRERALAMVSQKTGELRHQALHDALTGLPNRVLAIDRAEQMLAQARRTGRPVAALYVDLDGFKHINDTFGHSAGDELLLRVAERLKTVLRDGDTAARFGGDEFVVLLQDGGPGASPELVAERLLEALREPCELSSARGRALSVTASVGVAMARGGLADELLRNADLALYQAKAEGRDQGVVFQSSMEAASRDRVMLEMDLAQALEQEQLFLLYQPTVDLCSERVTGVEALIRWRHPTRGLLPPCDFIPLAEETGLIAPIGAWVLRTATLQAAQWARDGHELGVAVNVSARQLDADELLQDVSSALLGSGLDAGLLTLEITETALMRDAQAAVGRLRGLKDLGVRIAIDDFGTGYSSLAYLRQFPVDCLKIDRSFVSDVASEEESAALIRTLVQLGAALEIETLAEGIEDDCQLRALQLAGCDIGQGFLFSRPVSPTRIEGLLQEHSISIRPFAAARPTPVAA